MHTARKVAIYNLKGGTAKSTTVVNFAAALAAMGHKVLVLDLDPQGSASKSLGNRCDGRALRDVLVDADGATQRPSVGEKTPFEEAIVTTSVESVDLLAGGTWLADVEPATRSIPLRELILADLLTKLPRPYDFVLMDCPPSPGLLNILALFAADSYVTPVEAKGEAIDGFIDAMTYLSQINASRRRLKRDPLVEDGVLMCMYDTRTTLSRKSVKAMRDRLGERVFTTVIHRNIAISQGYLEGKPVVLNEPSSTGAKLYKQAARELARRLESSTGQEVHR